MNSYFKRFLTFTLVGSISGIVVFLLFNLTGPKSYDDCVLKHMKNVQSDRAASIIASTCRKQFPPKYISEEEFMGKK